ncbi:MAG: primosomal protein N' [Paludibacteraceae bacterium]|nr:primosomal protein N' [Paludibacteraceae bacterium]
MQMYVDVILPLPLANTYTYLLPEEFSGDVKMGARVIVPFGKSKIYTALVYNIHFSAPENVELKSVISVLDGESIVRPGLLRFWEWLSNYYQCTLGEIFKAALPSGLKLESETIISLVEDFEAEAPLKSREQELLDQLSRKPKTLTELSRELNVKNILPLVKRLIELGAVEINEELKFKYRPKIEKYVRLTPQYFEGKDLETLFETIKKYPKQEKVLLTYLQLSAFFNQSLRREVSKKELLDQNEVSGSSFSTLEKNGVFEIYKKEVGRIETIEQEVEPIHPLTEAQEVAMTQIKQQFSEKLVVLLHGVTSSGKTEVYIHLIQDVVSRGEQALFLLPEIALTTQITNRLRKVFGEKLLVYHSKFSDVERVEIWKKLLEDEGGQVVLGVRSSVFLPFKKLGLIVVDEEHETTYKQYDPAPRYHAGNSSIVLAMMHKAKVLLGSATPSIESYNNAMNGKFGLVELKQRYAGMELPEIKVANIKEARRKKELREHFTPELIEEMRLAFQRKEQVILFQNRRGFSPYVECRSCSYIPKCENCDISLSYHKNREELVCHYCGYTIALPKECPHCHIEALEPVGFGTERVEETVKEIFPNVKVCRLDVDTAGTKSAHEKIIREFEEGKVDVLVGTQMVSKGLDFERVRLVGILSADALLNFPDFRAYERAYQMMAQVSGRAGRKNKRGLVVIQTNSPDHPVIELVKNNDYQMLYKEQILQRQVYKYPPFYRLIYINLKGREFEKVEKAAQFLAVQMRKVFSDRVYGPDRPVVMRVQQLYIQRIMLKVEQTSSFDKAKELLKILTDQTLSLPQFKSLFIQIDVDPM